MAACLNGDPTASTSASGRPTPIVRPRSNTTRRRTAELVARYADGVELVIRNDGWLPLGSCPVRFEGETGWVEAGDSGKLVLSSPELLAGQKVAEIGGYPATFHVRDFLICVRRDASHSVATLRFARLVDQRPASCAGGSGGALGKIGDAARPGWLSAMHWRRLP